MENPLNPKMNKCKVEELNMEPITVTGVTDYEMSSQQKNMDKLFNTQRERNSQPESIHETEID